MTASRTSAAAVSHRVPLDGTSWSMWRDVGLRSAGFPAGMVLAIDRLVLSREQWVFQVADSG